MLRRSLSSLLSGLRVLAVLALLLGVGGWTAPAGRAQDATASPPSTDLTTTPADTVVTPTETATALPSPSPSPTLTAAPSVTATTRPPQSPGHRSHHQCRRRRIGDPEYPHG